MLFCSSQRTIRCNDEVKEGVFLLNHPVLSCGVLSCLVLLSSTPSFKNQDELGEVATRVRFVSMPVCIFSSIVNWIE